MPTLDRMVRLLSIFLIAVVTLAAQGKAAAAESQMKVQGKIVALVQTSSSSTPARPPTG